jgi:hypothetical protein
MVQSMWRVFCFVPVNGMGHLQLVSKLDVRQMSALSCGGPYESLGVYHCKDLDVRFCGLILQALRKLEYELQKQTILNIVLTNEPKWRERFGQLCRLDNIQPHYGNCKTDKYWERDGIQ